MRKLLQTIFFLFISTFLFSSCSILDACFNSHLAKEGKKYKKYGKSKSGSKSLSSKKYKITKGKASDEKKYDKTGKLIPSYASNLDKSVSGKVYSKAQLKAIERQNKKLHKHHKGGQGKFRYPYQITSPYSKEDSKKEKSKKKEEGKEKKKSEEKDKS